MISDKFNNFLSNTYAANIARANRFEVEITPPAKLGIDYTLLRHLTFVTESVQIPSQTVATTESKVNGLPVIPMPYQFSYGNQLNMTFNLSQDYRERNLLLLWQNLVYKPLGGLRQGFGYYNDYVGTIIVKALDYSNEVVQHFIFRNCFPSAVLDMSYNWGNSEKMNQEVTFTFFSMETSVSTPTSGIDNMKMINGAMQELYNLNRLFRF
jgi:hypothetical protein